MQSITDCCNGLLSRCVRAGNLTAEFFLAKAILLGRKPLCTEIRKNALQNRSIKCATGLPLSERRYIVESPKTGFIADLPYILYCSEDLPNIHESYERLPFTRLVKLFFYGRTQGIYLHFVAICLSLLCFLRDTILLINVGTLLSLKRCVSVFRFCRFLTEDLDRYSCRRWRKYRVELGFVRRCPRSI